MRLVGIEGPQNSGKTSIAKYVASILQRVVVFDGGKLGLLLAQMGDYNAIVNSDVRYSVSYDRMIDVSVPECFLPNNNCEISRAKILGYSMDRTIWDGIMSRIKAFVEQLCVELDEDYNCLIVIGKDFDNILPNPAAIIRVEANIDERAERAFKRDGVDYGAFLSREMAENEIFTSGSSDLVFDTSGYRWPNDELGKRIERMIVPLVVPPVIGLIGVPSSGKTTVWSGIGEIRDVAMVREIVASYFIDRGLTMNDFTPEIISEIASLQDEELKKVLSTAKKPVIVDGSPLLSYLVGKCGFNCDVEAARRCGVRYLQRMTDFIWLDETDVVFQKTHQSGLERFPNALNLVISKEYKKILCDNDLFYRVISGDPQRRIERIFDLAIL